MMRNTFETLNKFICFVKKNRRIKPNPINGIVKINIGSGLAVQPGWLNVDASMNALFSSSPKWVKKRIYKISRIHEYFSVEKYIEILDKNKYVHHNIQHGIPFLDNSVDVLYSSHMLEHLYKEDAEEFMKEAYRVIKKGGGCRICVPDLNYAIEMLRNGDKRQSLDQFFFQVKAHNYLARHKYMYDYEMLSGLLKSVGFKDVKKCEYKQSSLVNVSLLDGKPDETLFIEGIK